MSLLSERQRRWWIPGSTRSSDVLWAGVGAMLLLLVLSAASGQIQVNNGYGYDGADYVEMVNDGLTAGTPSTRLRPVVVLIATAVDRLVFDDPVATFRAINVVFAGLLALLVADLSRRYGASRAATAVLVGNLGLCIATAKMFAFYPTLVDLGAYVFMAAGAWAIVTGRRVLIVLLGVLAVLSREFAGVLVLFGLVRELRMRRSWWTVAATYAPIVAAIAFVRWFAASHVDADETARALAAGSLLAALRENLAWWSDPQYAAFWLYFAATLFGGVSLALLTSWRPWWRCLRREPEWLAVVLPIVAVTAVGYIDMWRYSAFVLPAVPALWAWTVSDLPPARARWCFAVVTIATLVTQRPWQAMDVPSYFRDWFPYFLVVEEPRTAAATLWPLWTYRLGAAAVLALLVLWLSRRPRFRGPETPRAVSA
jgi:hypothetical protein